MRFAGLPLTGVTRDWGLRVSAAEKRQEIIDGMISKHVDYVPQRGDVKKQTVNEECYMLIGERRGKVWAGRLQERSEGEPTSVAFDWAKVLVREESFGDVLGFYHTHPNSAPYPSPRDVRTMQAWATCFGKPLLCVIQSGALLAGYLFDPNGQCKPVGRITRLAHNTLIAVE